MWEVSRGAVERIHVVIVKRYSLQGALKSTGGDTLVQMKNKKALSYIYTTPGRFLLRSSLKPVETFNFVPGNCLIENSVTLVVDPFNVKECSSYQAD